MAGFRPGIHVLVAFQNFKTWMAGTSPATTQKMITSGFVP